MSARFSELTLSSAHAFLRARLKALSASGCSLYPQVIFSIVKEKTYDFFDPPKALSLFVSS